jgi:hypothetical protein
MKYSSLEFARYHNQENLTITKVYENSNLQHEVDFFSDSWQSIVRKDLAKKILCIKRDSEISSGSSMPEWTRKT